MNPVRILAAATAMEVCAAAAVIAVAGLFGWRSGWLDVINSFAPFVLVAALLGAGLAALSLDPGLARAMSLALALVAVLCTLALIAPELARWRPAGGAGGASFRILSANVWRDNPSPDLAVSAIIARNADVVLLQESSGSLQGELRRLRPLYPYSSDCRGSGVQIFVKSPILAQGCGLDSKTDADRDLAWIETKASGGRRIVLVTVHFSQPFPPAKQQTEREALARRLHGLPSGDMILAGDFNTTPWSFAMRRQDASLEPLRRRTIGWFSWPARLNLLRRSWPIPLLPIDHIYVGPNWEAVRLTRLRIPGSDHFGAEATLTPTPLRPS
jgi:endonuclease/exonuclease/phosphatase (EEP) superfamily protein YafD